jgi:hypothetical protein
VDFGAISHKGRPKKMNLQQPYPTTLRELRMTGLLADYATLIIA